MYRYAGTDVPAACSSAAHAVPSRPAWDPCGASQRRPLPSRPPPTRSPPLLSPACWRLRRQCRSLPLPRGHLCCSGWLPPVRTQSHIHLLDMNPPELPPLNDGRQRQVARVSAHAGRHQTHAFVTPGSGAHTLGSHTQDRLQSSLHLLRCLHSPGLGGEGRQVPPIPQPLQARRRILDLQTSAKIQNSVSCNPFRICLLP